jgi:hypothetical protein
MSSVQDNSEILKSLSGSSNTTRLPFQHPALINPNVFEFERVLVDEINKLSIETKLKSEKTISENKLKDFRHSDFKKCRAIVEYTETFFASNKNKYFSAPFWQRCRCPQNECYHLGALLLTALQVCRNYIESRTATTNLQALPLSLGEKISALDQKILGLQQKPDYLEFETSYIESVLWAFFKELFPDIPVLESTPISVDFNATEILSTALYSLVDNEISWPSHLEIPRNNLSLYLTRTHQPKPCFNNFYRLAKAKPDIGQFKEWQLKIVFEKDRLKVFKINSRLESKELDSEGIYRLRRDLLNESVSLDRESLLVLELLLSCLQDDHYRYGLEREREDLFLSKLALYSGEMDLIFNTRGEAICLKPEKVISSVVPGKFEENSDVPFFELRVESLGPLPMPFRFVSAGKKGFYFCEQGIYEGPNLRGFRMPANRFRLDLSVLKDEDFCYLAKERGIQIDSKFSGDVNFLRVKIVFSTKIQEDGKFKIQANPNITRSDGLEKASYNSGDPASSWFTGDQSLAISAKKNEVKLLLKNAGFDGFLSKTMSSKSLLGLKSLTAALPADYLTEFSTELNAGLSPTPIEVKLNVKPSGIDWFDIDISIYPQDVILTKEEKRCLILNGQTDLIQTQSGQWKKFELSNSQELVNQFAALGLDLSLAFEGESQSMHVLQIDPQKAKVLGLSDVAARQIESRRDQIKLKPKFDIPKDSKITPRSYQIEGYNFLNFLSENNFGGILADDMGLGKTFQTLMWLNRLKYQTKRNKKNQKNCLKTLVVAPKSVCPNWIQESKKFFLDFVFYSPSNFLEIQQSAHTHFVINYAQLRLWGPHLKTMKFETIVLDEAQAIKNPTSETTQTAHQLKANFRLALSGTPVENRLLDMWSIMNFCQPGILGLKSHFKKLYDNESDPNTRIRLAARIKPFVLRRTKGEVLKELPEKIEKVIQVSMSEPQLLHYNIELKKIRQFLLGITLKTDFKKSKIHLLASLTNLRILACDHGLKTKNPSLSPKIEALLEACEPIIEQNEKILVFSQFVGFLENIHNHLKRNFKNIPIYILTGQSNDRESLIETFSAEKGAAIFLISLKAGGFGLNLSPANHVFIMDPWWNPAVESQAADRAHRMGQKKTVFVYRIRTNHSIEEKIEKLKEMKNSFSLDSLSGEGFAKAITQEDIHFLLEDTTETPRKIKV